MGENIGDLGGITIAHKAYLLSLQGEEPPVIDGLTGSQRVFLGWGQVWRTATREAEQIRRLAIDPHSPPELRANVVRNLDEFHDAFAVTEGDGMWLRPDAARPHLVAASDVGSPPLGRTGARGGRTGGEISGRPSPAGPRTR